MSRNDGGTAFPMQDPQAIHAYAHAKTSEGSAKTTDERDQNYIAARAEAIGGMSLRDYFAGQVISTLLRDLYSAAAAERAYEIADAMISERAK